MIKGDFIDNLPKVYAMYTGGFLVFVLLMAIFEKMGMEADTIGILFRRLLARPDGWPTRTSLPGRPTCSLHPPAQRSLTST